MSNLVSRLGPDEVNEECPATEIQPVGGVSPSKFRFTIWHLLVLMTTVAVIYSIDESVAALLMGVAVCGAVIGALLLVIPLLTQSKRQDRPAKIERALIRFLTQLTVWSVTCLIFVVTAMALKLLVTAIGQK